DDAAAAELERRELPVAGVAAPWAERARREEHGDAVAALDALHRVALVDLAPEAWGLHQSILPKTPTNSLRSRVLVFARFIRPTSQRSRRRRSRPSRRRCARGRRARRAPGARPRRRAAARQSPRLARARWRRAGGRAP